MICTKCGQEVDSYASGKWCKPCKNAHDREAWAKKGDKYEEQRGDKDKFKIGKFIYF